MLRNYNQMFVLLQSKHDNFEVEIRDYLNSKSLEDIFSLMLKIADDYGKADTDEKVMRCFAMYAIIEAVLKKHTPELARDFE